MRREKVMFKFEKYDKSLRRTAISRKAKRSKQGLSGLNLACFLEKKGAEYAPFDPMRFRHFYERYRPYFNASANIIQIVGTNGKGTTGRFMAQMLKNAGFYVGHFTSPHIVRLNERFWYDGAEIDDLTLEQAHMTLINRFKTALDELSYFEYLTLLGYELLAKRVDYLILEAGVGGEFDSTTVLPKILLLVTTIGFDHQDMLGRTIEEISRTKLRAATGKTIIGFQEYEAVARVARELALDTLFLDEIPDSQFADVDSYSTQNGFAPYLEKNLSLAYIGIQQLGITPHVAGLQPLFGRMSRIAPNILLDVGHNTSAAAALSKALGKKQATFIFNCYADKDAEGVLRILKKHIAYLELFPVCVPRIMKRENLEKILNTLEIPFGDFSEIRPEREYIVFGSFSVVAAFLEQYNAH